MVDPTPTPAPSSALADLEQRLADPEPMCLAMVAVEPSSAPPGVSWTPSQALIDELHHRLRANLRRYDELVLLDDGRFAIVLRTLADATVLANRMDRIFAAIDAPYVMGGTSLSVRALLGAAIRHPQEGTGAFLSRVCAAVDEARDAGATAPVIH